MVLVPTSQPAINGERYPGADRHIGPHLLAVCPRRDPPRTCESLDDAQSPAAAITWRNRYASRNPRRIVVSGDSNMVAMNLHGQADRNTPGLDRVRGQLAHYEQAILDHV
jgi:hypothetical protein